MSSRSEIDYFLQRERQERARAASCKDVTARCVHLEMAQRYHDRAQAAPSPAPVSFAA